MSFTRIGEIRAAFLQANNAQDSTHGFADLLKKAMQRTNR
jgi:hypothetical protein